MHKQSLGQHKRIDTSADNIEISQKQYHNGSKSLLEENKFIKKQNQVLRKELESISIRLDAEIRRRMEEGKKRQVGRVEDVSQMELKNAYKKCQIYKKQVSFYRKKMESFEEQNKTEDYDKKKAQQIVKENKELREQLKQMQKITKMQEKGLTEMGAQGYLKIAADKDKLQDEVRRLKKQLDQYRREKGKSSSKHRTQTQSFQNSKGEIEISAKDIKFQEQVKKRIKTQQNNSEDNSDLTEILQQKMQKDYHKMRAVVNQKTKLREIVDNLKMQLAEKQKQNTNLKQKIANLRKNNQLLQNQLNSKNISDLQQSVVAKRQAKSKSKEHQSSVHSKSRLSRLQGAPPKQRVWKRNSLANSQGEGEIEHDSQVSNEIPKETRKQQRGSKLQNIIKWSHQNLSSKIRQIRVLVHEKGHIKDIHACYEKGEPKKYEHAGKTIYNILSCSEGEYVKHVEGCFALGYLQYITVTTNHRRVQKFGNWKEYEDNQQADHFLFQVGEGEYPGALFGQSDPNGVRRLGCCIHKQG